MFNPFRRKHRGWMSEGAILLAVGIGYIIRGSRDEKTAIERICRHLRMWDLIIDPSELGSEPYDD